MSAPECLKLSRLSLAALRVQELRAAGQNARVAEGQLLELAQPMIKGEARHWVTRAGTVQFEDLTQTATLITLRAVDTWAGQVPFKVHARSKVRAALRDLVGSQGRDVTPSDHARRGRRGEKTWTCEVSSMDASEGARAELEAVPLAAEEVERAPRCDAESVREVLEQLPTCYRELLSALYGVCGQEPISLREFARREGKTKTQVQAELCLALKAARLLAGC